MLIKASTLALAGLATFVIVAPAPAQKKEPGLRLNPALLQHARAADAALTRGETALAAPLVAQAEAAAVSDQERYIAAALRYRAEAASLTARQTASPGAATDPGALARALDTLIANPVTPGDERARYAYHRAELAYLGRQYKVANDLFARANELGYRGPDEGLTALSARVAGGDTVGGTAELERIVAAQAGKGQPAPPEYYRYAIARLSKAGATAQAVVWMGRYATAFPAPKTWYEVLSYYGLQQNPGVTLNDRQRLDVLRLMRAADAVPDEYHYTQYAQIAQRLGLVQEAQAVLKEGTAKGRLPAASATTKATLALRPVPLTAAAEAKANAAATGVLAAQAGDALLAGGNDAKAAALYRTALGKGGVDVNAVNLHLGIALARSGDRAGAQAAFAAVGGSPDREIASFWTNWLNSRAAPAPAA